MRNQSACLTGKHTFPMGFVARKPTSQPGASVTIRTYQSALIIAGAGGESQTNTQGLPKILASRRADRGVVVLGDSML
jgi:hypothetical protein